MSHIELVCVECGSSHEADMIALSCQSCGSPLDVGYRDADAHTMTFADLRMPVPFHSDSPTVTMGEGSTPLVALPSVEETLGLGGVRVVAKLEFMNPTGSFKDRGTSTMLTVAMEHGVRAVVEDSSGNAGASVSAYAARAGIAAHVFAPESAPEAKIGQIRVYEAETHPTPGPREASTEAAVDFQRRHDMVYASHNLSPYFVEGTKTFAYEIATQMATAPDHIVIPVGNGSLLLGAWKAYRELIERRVSSLKCRSCTPSRPRRSCHWRPSLWELTGSLARPPSLERIAVGSPPRLRQALRAIRESGGTSIAVTDASIVRWQKLLAAREGIFAEPTSAAAFAGLELMAERSIVKRGEVALVPVTGFGLKDALPEYVNGEY